MQWLLIICLFILAGHSVESAVPVKRCPPGTVSQENSCTFISDLREEIKSEREERSILHIDAECQPKSKWDSNCHTCECNELGAAKCVKRQDCHNELEPIRCKPNSTFIRDCNTCVCLENGLGLCSLENCGRSAVPKKSELLPGKECSPGSTWKSQCNVCNCNNDGIAVCSLLSCPEQQKEPIIKCAPNTMWKKDCNTCWCTNSGKAMCTRMGCMVITDFGDEEKIIDTQPHTKTDEDHMERHTVCKPRDIFYVSCNACYCNDIGTDYVCTNKPCPLPKDVEVFHELNVAKTSKNDTKSIVCVANRMFIKDCNNCWCNDDGTSFYCTRRVCVPMLPGEMETGDPTAEKLREVETHCEPDAVFEIDCNMCRCNPDGKSFSCTRRACIEEDKKKSSLSRKVRASQQAELPKACQPGQEFRMDCNKCLCDNAGQNFSCTRIDCNAVNNNHGTDAFTSTRTKREVTRQDSQKCVPGTVFDRGCNVCRCTDEGHHATCTLKRCRHDNNIDTQAEQDPGFRCNAGEQFTRDCNDCTCSADGKSIFCTIRLCDEDLTQGI